MKKKGIIKRNPNATAVATTGTAGTLLVWALGLLGVAIPPAIAVALVAAATTALVAVGKYGIKGLIARVWGGSEESPEDADPELPEEQTWEG